MEESLKKFNYLLNICMIVITCIWCLNFGLPAISTVFYHSEYANGFESVPIYYFIWYVLIIIALYFIIWRKRTRINLMDKEEYRSYIGYKFGTFVFPAALFISPSFFIGLRHIDTYVWMINFTISTLINIFYIIYLVGLPIYYNKINDSVKGFLKGCIRGIFTTIGLILIIPILFMGTCALGVLK